MYSSSYANNMKTRFLLLLTVTVGFCTPLAAQQLTSTGSMLQYIRKPVRGIPVSQAVKGDKTLFVSGMPPFGDGGKIVAGDFSARMKQVMDNLTRVLKSSGVGWDRVVKTTVYLTRFRISPR